MSKPKLGKDVYDRDQLRRMREDGDKKRKARGDHLDLTGAKGNRYVPYPQGDALVETIINYFTSGEPNSIDEGCDAMHLLAQLCKNHHMSLNKWSKLWRRIEREAVERSGDALLPIAIGKGFERRKFREKLIMVH